VVEAGMWRKGGDVKRAEEGRGAKAGEACGMQTLPRCEMRRSGRTRRRRAGVRTFVADAGAQSARGTFRSSLRPVSEPLRRARGTVWPHITDCATIPKGFLRPTSPQSPPDARAHLVSSDREIWGRERGKHGPSKGW